MRQLLLLFVFSMISVPTFSQQKCGLNDIFSVQPGMTRFVAINMMNSADGYTKKFEKEELYQPDYLKEQKQSARLTILVYSVPKSTCMSSEDAEVQLIFDGDKLFKVKYTLKYESSSFKVMKEQYSRLTSIVKNSHIFKNSSPTTKRDETEKMQIGEGWSYWNPQKNKDNDEGVYIDYTLERKNNLGHDFKWTNEEHYLVCATWVDLNQTVLDNRGYY